jgi:integrase/recombinase XerD
MQLKERRSTVVRRRWSQLRKDDLSLEKLVMQFQIANQAEGKSPRTVHWYEERLGMFLRFLREQGHPLVLRDVGLDEGRAFVVSLQAQTTKFANNPMTPTRQEKLSPYYIRSTVLALRAFFHWLQEEGYTENHKLAALAVPKVPQRLVEILTKEEMQRVLDCFDPATDVGARGQAIFALVFDRGLRASEILGLGYDNVNLVDGWVKVFGKGAKERLVGITPGAMKAVLHYREHFRPGPARPSVDSFFLSVDGEPLTYNALKSIAYRAAQRSGISRLEMHLCRHSFATWYLVDGGDSLSLQRILGHSTLTMTSYYVHLAQSLVAMVRRSTSPMDSLRVGGRHGARRTRKGNRSAA